METFCACCFSCSARANQQHLYNLILSVYIVRLFLPLLRNSESGTIALSRERWKWKWIEFPEIQRVALSPAQAMFKCIYFNCKKLQPRQQQTYEIPTIPNCCLHLSAEYIIYTIQIFIMFNILS